MAGLRVLELLLEQWDPTDVLVIAPAPGIRHDWQPSVADAAIARGVTVLEPDDVNDSSVVDRVAEHGADLLLSVYYTQIFRAPLLGNVDGLALNFHPALLPRHRGTAPLIWAIADGDGMAGVSVHEITLGIDTGPLYWQKSMPIHRNDTGHSLHLKATNLVAGIAADLVRRLRSGHPLPTPVEQSGQASAHSSRDPKLNRIDWRDAGERVRNVVRALAAPLPGAYSTWRGERIGIERVELIRSSQPSRTPGMVQIDDDGSVLVWAGDGPVRIEAVRRGGDVVPAATLVDRGVGEGELLS